MTNHWGGGGLLRNRIISGIFNFKQKNFPALVDLLSVSFYFLNAVLSVLIE